MTAHTTTATPAVHIPDTVSEAVDLIASGSAEVLSGGTWIMRGEAHGVGYSSEYVLVSRLPELNRLEFIDDHLIIGAAVTHDRLARFLAGDTRFDGLQTAARKSANPAIRKMATLGGNLSTTDFYAADLTPALLTTSAEVSIEGSGGARSVPLEDFLADREGILRDSLITHVTVPVPQGISVHERITMRKAGDYPIVIVNLHVTVGEDGTITEAKAALGSVEPVARLWQEFADALVGSAPDAEAAEAKARELASGLSARDGVEAQGWYRLQILPALVKRAMSTIQRKAEAR